MCWVSGAVGTGGATDAGSRPLVSFGGAEGQQGKKSSAIHQSVTTALLIANAEEPFARSPSPGQWSVAAAIQVLNLRVKSTD